jgi:hypothetical protein
VVHRRPSALGRRNPRRQLAHIRADGSVDLAFQPALDNEVNSLLRDGSTLYVGGSFTRITGRVVSRLAGLDVSTGFRVTRFICQQNRFLSYAAGGYLRL